MIMAVEDRLYFGLWGSVTALRDLTCVLRGASVLVDETAEDRAFLDPFGGEVGGRVVGSRRGQSESAVGAVAFVVHGVLVENQPQVPFAEDEHPVGDLGADGADESFGVGVGLRALRW